MRTRAPAAAPGPDIIAPPLPPGRFVQLDERGTVLVRDFGGPAGAPTVVLLHGWTATADLNWFRCYSALGGHYRVIAFDHRGHGTGIRSKRTFRLEDCADDVIDVTRALGIDRFIAVGYSMGGPVAQLLWRRHPDAVDGLVLCATAAHVLGPARGADRVHGPHRAGRHGPHHARPGDGVVDRPVLPAAQVEEVGALGDPGGLAPRLAHGARGGPAIGSFSSVEWIGSIDVPVANVITMRDTVVPLERQTALFELIPGADVFRVDGAHDAVVANADRFVPTLLRAIDSVDRAPAVTT